MPKLVMEDGRFVTSYVTSCTLNASIQHQNGIKNNSDYRKFLQSHAETLMKRMSDCQCEHCASKKECQCEKCQGAKQE